MEESKKKPIMIAIVVVCLVAAAAVTLKTRSKDTGINRFSGKPQWVKCTNPDCGAEYTMDMKEYFEWREENVTISAGGDVGMVCRECEKETALGAIKCEKCGHVFFKGDAGADFMDTCPECDYSKSKEARRQAREAREARKTP